VRSFVIFPRLCDRSRSVAYTHSATASLAAGNATRRRVQRHLVEQPTINIVALIIIVDYRNHIHNNYFNNATDDGNVTF
jgi:hypothetical protein